MRLRLASLFLLASTHAYAAEGWFDYPSATQLKSMSAAITRLEAKADLVLPPATTGLTIVNSESSDDDGSSTTLCTLAYAASPDYRRLVAGTKLAVSSVEALGDTHSDSANSRARVRLALQSAGGFQATLECTYFYRYWSDDDDVVGSDSNQTPLTLTSWFRVQRKETIISRT
jgi:hypothetical protein